MVATVPFNPWATSNAAATFPGPSSNGFIQGCSMDSPAIRNELAGGVLASTETIPMWGGVAISEAIPGVAGQPREELGGTITRATNITANTAGQVTGFSVFDQAHHGIISPGSSVPLIPSYGSVHFYRIGSGARIPVKCSPNIVNLEGAIITQKVSWDFLNQQLEPYTSTTLSAGTYTTGTGATTTTTAAPHGLSPGDTFELNTMTGTGSFASLNGEWTATAGTTGSTLNFVGPSGLTLTITGGNVVSGGLLPVDVLKVNIGNSMTVTYDTVTGLATWNRSGNCALILI